MVHKRNVHLTSFHLFFFFNDTATTEISTLSLHDALPISYPPGPPDAAGPAEPEQPQAGMRSEEHTSELQSRVDLVCRLLLEKKNNVIFFFVFFHINKCIIELIQEDLYY